MLRTQPGKKRVKIQEVSHLDNFVEKNTKYFRHK